MQIDTMTQGIVAAGAVGAAAMGLVEALKVVSLGEYSLALCGLGKVQAYLGGPAVAALRLVYGGAALPHLLEGAWRKGPAELEQVLSDGLRMAVFADLKDAPEFIESFGQRADEIARAIARLRQGNDAPPDAADPAAARERVARLEAAIDARVRAAVAAGRDKYASSMQFTAMLVALVGSICVAVATADGASSEVRAAAVGQAILIGLLAVPIAPVAKDLVSFLNSLRDVFAKRGGKT